MPPRTHTAAPSPRLHAIAPRLAVAHAQRRTELEAARQERRRVRNLLMHKERLVAHRELQLVRAMARPGKRRHRASYIAVRQKKLVQARKELAQVQRRADRLGV